MYSQTSRIVRHLSIASLIVATGLALSGAALAGPGSGPGSSIPQPDLNVGLPGFFNGPVIKHADDFAIECGWRQGEGQGVVVGTYVGNIWIDSVADVEQWKCVTWVKGNLTISPDWDAGGENAWDATCPKPANPPYTPCPRAGLAMLPWLHAVSGDLTLEAAYTRGEFRMPRLYYVSGEIKAENSAGTDWRSRSLTEHKGTLRATAKHGVDLRGFNWLVELGRLEIYASVSADPNVPGSIWRGLSALEVIGSLDINAGDATAWPEFLESLDVVEGKAEIDVRAALFGIGSLREVGGTLDIRVKDSWNVGYADGLESLEFVGGDFLWDASGSDLHGLKALANLHTVGGDFEPPLSVNTLEGLESLTHVGGDLTLSGQINWGEDLAPLASLQTVGGRLTIEQFAVSSLHGLEGLQSVGDLRIHANPTLGSVSALHGMTVKSGGVVKITDNTPLTWCQANSLVDQIKATGWSGSSDTSGNQYCFT
jgi:hypothetical protein